MRNILLVMVFLQTALFAQSRLGDLRTDKTDTLYIRTEVDVNSDEFIGLKQQDILDVVKGSVKPLNMLFIPVKDSESNPEEFLSFSIYIIKNYYTVIAEYKRKVLYRARKDFYEMPAPTWRRMIGGGHGSEKKYILDVVKEIADSFTKQFKEQNDIQ
jgi:hypothetical protein